MSFGLINVLQSIVIGVEMTLAVGDGVGDALGVSLCEALELSVGVGEGVGTQPLSAASASAERARGTTMRLRGMPHCLPDSLSADPNTPAR